MIRELTGDILLSEADVIVHGVAPHDHFDNGLALALREKWPAMVKDFRHHCHQSNPKPGGIFVWSGPGTRIANLLTQDPAQSSHSKPNKATLPNVNHSLRKLRQFIDEEKINSIAMPRLATGVGCLDWNDVKPLIDRHLGDLKISVNLYSSYEKGTLANET